MTAQNALHLRENAVAAAEAAGLLYVETDAPGFSRRRHGRGFAYYTGDGQHVKDDALRERFEKLAIPPAWTDVWICPHENGHILVTGRDEQGRKQYIYHPQWQSIREHAKFNALIPFAEGLPRLRRRVRRDLRIEPVNRRKVAAAVVKLLDKTAIRIGYAHYARANASYGLTTILKDHVDVDGEEVVLAFTGKAGVEHEKQIRDERVAEVIRNGLDTPGAAVFTYLDEDGSYRNIDAADVNAYIQDVLGEQFSAKDFRTWTGTVLAAEEMAANPAGEADSKPCSRTLTAIVEAVASELGNTPQVCRAYYVHPALISLYESGAFAPVWTRNYEQASRSPVRDLTRAETATLGVLRESVD